MPSGQTVAQHQRKQERAADAEQTANHRAKQTPQSQRAHPNLEEDHERGGQRSPSCVDPCIQTEWAEEPAGNRKNKNKKKTKCK